jgi:hypothetical protein
MTTTGLVVVRRMVRVSSSSSIASVCSQTWIETVPRAWMRLYARLTDGQNFGVGVTGVREGCTLDTLRPNGGRPVGHMAVNHQA